MEAWDHAIGSRLCLTWRAKDYCLDAASGESVTIGRADDVHIRTQLSFASRVHAWVAREGNYFVLTDCSTNGTLIETEDQQVTFVHRQTLRLWGSGFIRFGQNALQIPSPVLRFAHL